MITVKNPDKVKKHFIRLRVTEEEHDMFVKELKRWAIKQSAI